MFIRSGYSAQTRRTGSGTEHHHLAGRVFLGLADDAGRLGAQPRALRLPPELLLADAVEFDHILFARFVPALGPVAGEHDPLALDPDRLREHPDAQRA